MPNVKLLGRPLIFNELSHPDRFTARCTGVCDGDTIRCILYLGFNITMDNVIVRINGIQAPELHGPERIQAVESRSNLQRILSNRWLVLDTHGEQVDRWGRLVADVFYEDQGELIDLSNLLIRDNRAKRWAYAPVRRATEK